jgi:hypothetical protein
MISCERYTELKSVLECKVFNLLEAIIMSMKVSRFDVFLSRSCDNELADLIGFIEVFMKAVFQEI